MYSFSANTDCQIIEKLNALPKNCQYFIKVSNSSQIPIRKKKNQI